MGRRLIAYSYVRFSTPEQRLGDSLRRQISRAEEWCRANQYSLDSTLKDEGVSGYRHKNSTSGALATFLDAIRNGDVTPGSVLVVESLDRLSRAEPLDALALLREIIKAGVHVVTLYDGQKYSQASMREIGPLLQALVIMSRAHEESHMKAQRLSASWSSKRDIALAQKQPVTRQVPAWIQVEDVGVSLSGRHEWSKARFKLIPERAAILREIFRLRAEGLGRRRIADELNRRGIAVWGRGKRKARGGWQDSYIAKILSTRAVLGEFQPHRLEAGRNSTRTPVGPPIEGYYPRAISDGLWAAAQVYSSEARQHKGRTSTSALLSGLLSDPTGAPMHIERKGGASGNYYVTARPFRRAGLTTHRWRIDHLDAAVRKLIQEIDWRSVFSTPTGDSAQSKLRSEVAVCDEKAARIRERLQAAADRLLDPDFESVKEELKKTIADLKEQQAGVEKAQAEATRRLKELSDQSDAASSGGAALKEAATAKLDERGIVRFRRELRSLVERIIVYPDGNADGFDRLFVQFVREQAAARLHGNRGLQARQSLQVCGAIRLKYRNGQQLTIFLPYRRMARTAPDFRPIAADGVGYTLESEKKAKAHLRNVEKRRKGD